MAKKKKISIPKNAIGYSKDEYQVLHDYKNEPHKFFVVAIKQDKVLRAVSYLTSNHAEAVDKLLKPMFDISDDGFAITVKMDVKFDVFFDYDDDSIRYNKTKKPKTYPEFDSWSTDFDNDKVLKQVRSSEEYKQAEAKITAIRDGVITGIESLLAKDKEIKHDLTPAQINDVIQKLASR